MNSFNFDYIFNIFYNFLLALRYAVVFWILRIDKIEYLKDHADDYYDGLRDRGWIDAHIYNPTSETLNLANDKTGNIQDIKFVTGKVSNSYPFNNLEFSIQNKVLAFFSDLLSVLAFFVFLIFIFTFFSWVFGKITVFKKLKENLKKSEDEYKKVKEQTDKLRAEGKIVDKPINKSQEKKRRSHNQNRREKYH